MTGNIKRFMFGICVAFVLLSAFVGILSASTIYVPDNYTTIQTAVNAASLGDTIIVGDGTYIENIKVKRRLTIRSESGPDTTIIRAAKNEDHVFEVTANYVNISGFTMEGAMRGSAGIYLHDTDYCNISNNNCSNNRCGIFISYSNNNNISTNRYSNNSEDGIYLWFSTNNSISNNNCSNNTEDGIHLWNLDNNNSISNNNCSNNNEDIHLYESKSNSIVNNTCSNHRNGIYLWYSDKNKLKGNIMLENGIVIEGYSLSDYTHEIDKNSTVNGKPVYYWKDVEGGRIPDGAGQIILVNSTNIAIKNQNLNNASVGIQIAFSSFITIKNNNYSNGVDGIPLWYSNKSSISNNNCSNNKDGVHLIFFSYNNRISNNTCSNKDEHGIYLEDSYNNVIYLNNFINKNDNVGSYNSHNTWNSTSEITYIYDGSTYTNNLGNYWDDYTGTDTDGDGIGDTAYIVNSDKDNYPLIEPQEIYVFNLTYPS